MYYSYFLNLGLMTLNIMPPFARNVGFKLLFDAYGKNVFIDYGIYFRFPRKIRIGSEVTVGRQCAFYPSYFNKSSRIVIGDNVRVGPSVAFLASGHDYRFRHLPDTGGSITIENDVWIGANATILANVTIGNGAVIAAGSLVKDNVAPFHIVGGVPAKFIKKREIQQQ